MKDWYKKPFFDPLKWLIDNYSKLDVSDKEFILLMIIQYATSTNQPLSYEYLLEKANVSSNELDVLIAKLCEKKYLKLGSDINGLVFDITGVFEYQVEELKIDGNSDVFDLLAEVFHHPLSPMELQKISDLLDTYGQKNLLEAVRVAEANRVLKLAYIEKVLMNNEDKQW